MDQCRYTALNRKNLKPRHPKLKLKVLQQLTIQLPCYRTLLFVLHQQLTTLQHSNNKKAKEREKVKATNAQLPSLTDQRQSCNTTHLHGPPTHQRHK